MSLLAPTLEAFFTERLLTQRQASAHTVSAYRDTFRLLLRFAALCRALVYAELPSERCRFALRAGRIAAVEPRAARHNQRPSRKASSVSGAR
jgi:site-specific recombinase XerC